MRKSKPAAQKLDLQQALRLTPLIEPDVLPPNWNQGIQNGWLFNVYHLTVDVQKACTNAVHHSYGNWNKTTTQGTRSLYSTELLALRAGRSELATNCAEALAQIDNEIATLEKAQVSK